MTKATDMIAAERTRQITDEGYDSSHDHGHEGDLIAAAVGYAQAGGCGIPTSSYPSWVSDDPDDPAVDWPWHPSYWKPTGDPVRDLVKAGALIAAAIDSLTSNSGAVMERPAGHRGLCRIGGCAMHDGVCLNCGAHLSTDEEHGNG
jgi:hypothetical protein